MDIKKRLPLIIGLSIPLLMIIFVALSIYLPDMFINPKYDFIYCTGDYYSSRYYSVKSGKIQKNDIKYPEKDTYYRPRIEEVLYYHDTNKNESKEIGFDDALKYSLNSNVKSLDGFEVVHGTRDVGIFPLFFFADTDYSTMYIKGDKVSKKLNLNIKRPYYWNFQFIGWVEK